jgi:hypothetical protein
MTHISWAGRVVIAVSLSLTIGSLSAIAASPSSSPNYTERVDHSSVGIEAPARTRAQTARAALRNEPRSLKTHFVEFRARSALSYGHTFAAFGQLNSRGEIEKFEVAGLHPAGESSVPWSIGHVIAVPSETGPSDGDLEEEYVTARFRVDLTQDEARKVFAYIRKLQNSSPMWHAVIYNCSAFVADIGKFMGLSAPSSLLFPEDFINGMREMNAAKLSARNAASIN